MYFFESDTVLILADTIKYKRDSKQVTKEILENLKTRMGRRKLTKAIYDALISVPRDQFAVDSAKLTKSTQPFDPYEGKIIGDVALNKLTVFGPEVDDTTKTAKTIFQRAFNALHWKTSGNVIRNNLTVKKGETVTASRLADAERILRELPFIRDARIDVVPRPNSDTVDLVLITQDVFPYSFNIEPRDIDAGILDIDQRNLFGLGYEFDNRLQISNNQDQVVNYRGLIRIPNIRRSFTVGEFSFSNNYRERGVRANFYRDFITPQIKWAGGLELSHLQERGERFVPIDTSTIFFYSTYNQQDFWLGHAFKLGLANEDADERTRLILSGRFKRTDYINRPFFVTEESNQLLQNSNLFLGAIAISQRNYYKDRLIYGYGRTEDIPIGYYAEATFGLEKREFYNRNYVGFKASKGGFINQLGYLYTSFSYETFLKAGGIKEQGRIDLEQLFFTNLLEIKKWRFRQFITFQYTHGLNRFNDEFITINNQDGVRGLSNPFLRGTQRLKLNLETVAFTPIEGVGFRVALYGFADIGYINRSNVNIFSGRMYNGLGIGFRVRNDNLTFRAFEMRLAYYPNLPAGIDPFGIDFSGSTSRVSTILLPLALVSVNLGNINQVQFTFFAFSKLASRCNKGGCE